MKLHHLEQFRAPKAISGVGKWTKRVFAAVEPAAKPVIFPAEGARIIANNRLLEEKAHPRYSEGVFYPVKIGQVFLNRYQVVGKLGWGISCTVWLAHDLKEHQLIVLKICNSVVENRRELQIYRDLEKIISEQTSDKRGPSFMRQMLYSFKIRNRGKTHAVMVFAPLLTSVHDIRQDPKHRMIAERPVRLIIFHTLIALHYLHTECKWVHTDIKPDNILLEMDDESVLDEFMQDEIENPSARKTKGGRTIYESRLFETPDRFSKVRLCDFGSCEKGYRRMNHNAQADFFRAPEVMLRANWSYPVDIWSVGILAWLLLEGEFIVSGVPCRSSKPHSVQLHLAELIGLLGKPPRDFMRRCMGRFAYFDSEGNWKLDVPIPQKSFEAEEKVLSGDNKAHFIDFMKRTLQWRPEDRMTARQLMDHPWIRGDGDLSKFK